eukprot:gb/GEZN01000332.1/.p1 GENE.gb/GEZN01000332.1/~~gb/GEZN01000332.1/.p1  ORF type:complete len:1264 (+),score=321.05 gb/GEZN01000332.1/:544-4335(+)
MRFSVTSPPLRFSNMPLLGAFHWMSSMSMSKKKGALGEEQAVLQRKIFTRWVNQKILKAGIQIQDVVTDTKDGEPLIKLLEILGETKYPKKTKWGATQRTVQMNNANEAINWIMKEGKVEMKGVAPSAENLVDGEPNAILGLIWAIMLKYLKLEDDEDGGPVLNFKDSLLMWLKNQTASYPQCTVKDLTKSWYDGIALCCLIHKFRPKLMPNLADLNPDDGPKNLDLAFKAANKYFGLEEYVSTDDILSMDEKCMTVYLSEYYYGVATARKVDLAARRITNLIVFTKANDNLRGEFTDRSTKLVEAFKKAFLVLDDTAIDNTMAGAKARLAQFNAFKKEDKGKIYTYYYECENKYAELALRLAKHHRPEWKLDGGRTVPELKTKLQNMEKQEKERNVALHTELSRQIKLAKIYELYQAQYANSRNWVASKKAYLSEKTNVLSVGAAMAALNSLAAYNDEFKSLKADVVALMNKEATELLENKFEHSATVAANEQEITDGLKELEELAMKKKALHEDDLERETLKAKVRGWADDHLTMFKKLETHVNEKTKNLQKKETIESIADAQLHISILEYSIQEDKNIMPKVEPLKKIGQEILQAEYKTDLSAWKYEEPDEISRREKYLDDTFASMLGLGQSKMTVLKDDLARETFKQEIQKKNRTHLDKFKALKRFAEESQAYLDIKEPVNSISEAEMNLAAHHSYMAEQQQQEQNSIPALNAVGKEIISAEYKSDLSTWKFPTPEEVTSRQDQINKAFTKLTSTAAHKLKVLDDDLAREQFKAKLRQWNLQHVSLHEKLSGWIGVNKAYLEKVESCDSVADAYLNLKVLAAYVKDKEDVTSTQVNALKKFGNDILTADYKSELSAWKWETPEDVKSREKFVDDSWATLDTLSASKKAVSDKNLKDELRKEELRVEFANVASAFTRWARDVVGEATSTQFGLTLEEVEAFGAELKKKEDQVKERASKDQGSYEKVNAEMKTLGVTINPYTDLTTESLQASQAELAAALAARQTAYTAELEKQRRDDALCRALAELCDPFVKGITENRNDLETSKGTEDEKSLAKVVALLADEKTGEETLAKTKTAQEEVNKAGILYNRHTLNNALDASVVFEQYILYLQNKKIQLEKEIENRIMRGVTKEQYAEITQQWKTFDRDNSGSLDKREFKACLYSLGEERGTKEVIAIMEKYGQGKGHEVRINYEGFKEFMIEQLGDTDTREEILEGFKLINRLSETMVDELVEMVLFTEDIDYIKSTHKDDYIGWTGSVFDR